MSVNDTFDKYNPFYNNKLKPFIISAPLKTI